HGCDRSERHQLARRRSDERLRQSLGIFLIRRAELEDDGVIVAGGVDRRHLPRSERVVERGANLLRGETERRRLLTVDVENGLRALDLQIGAYVLEPRQLADFRVDQRRKPEEIVEIAGLQRLLVEALARARPDIEVLDGVQEDVHPGDRSNLAAQLLDHLADGWTLVAGFELNVEIPAV